MRSEEQKAEARKRCGRLYRNFKNLSWIIDDESIFTLSNNSSKCTSMSPKRKPSNCFKTASVQN